VLFVSLGETNKSRGNAVADSFEKRREKRKEKRKTKKRKRGKGEKREKGERKRYRFAAFGFRGLERTLRVP